MKTNLGIDKTGYAQSLGYAGKKSVRLLDGLVISHRDQPWSCFCEKLRKAKSSSAVGG